MPIKLRCYVLALFSIIQLIAINTAYGEDIKGESIRTMISNKTMVSSTGKLHEDVVWYFAADGGVIQRKKGFTSQGTWRIDEETGRLCIQLKDPISKKLEKEFCRVFVKEGNQLEWVGVKEDGHHTGKKFTVYKLVDGNVEKL